MLMQGLSGIVISTCGILCMLQGVLFIYRICYNLYFHPLRKYPGPRLFAASWIPYVIHKITGRLPFVARELHETYGPVVRTGPNELSFVSAQAWRDIYGQQPGLPQNPRDPYSYTDPDTDALMRHNIIAADDANHARQRRQLAHAFSTKALLQQQSLISTHVDTFIDQLQSHANQGPQDMNDWFIWVTFDIIGELAFGEPFGCLKSASNHPWILTVYQGALAGTVMAAIRRLGLNINRYLPNAIMKPRLDMIDFCRQRLTTRLARGEAVDRGDFTSFMLAETKKADPAMTTDELCANAEVMAIAGSETTATLLTGMVFLLLTERPDWLKKLTHEVRTTFETDQLEDLNFQTVTSKLPLLAATILEASRVYPPVATGHGRVINVQNRLVDGQVIPVGTGVTVYQWAANHYNRNWHRPDEFLPERWLDASNKEFDPKIAAECAKDQRDSMNIFSLGARGCLGRNLAEVEMRLVFARFLWNFDLGLVEGQLDWMREQRARILWAKGPLMVKLKSVS